MPPSTSNFNPWRWHNLKHTASRSHTQSLSVSLPPSLYFLFATRSFIHRIQFQFQLALLACARYIFVLPKFYNAVVSLCFSLNSRLSLQSHLLSVLLMKQLTNCHCSQTAAIIVLERGLRKCAICCIIYFLTSLTTQQIR